MNKGFLLLLSFFLLFGCQVDEDDDCCDYNPLSIVLYLQVKYTDNTFMGGNFLSSANENPLQTYYDFEPPGDFGNLSIMETSSNELLFDGSIIWAGVGERTYPSSILEPSYFDALVTADYVEADSYENIFTEMLEANENEYQAPWAAIQNLVEVRNKLEARPQMEVKYFLYQPSVGYGNPEDWYWVFLLK